MCVFSFLCEIVHVFFLFFLQKSSASQAFCRGPDSCLLLPQGAINREGGVVIYLFFIRAGGRGGDFIGVTP